MRKIHILLVEDETDVLIINKNFLLGKGYQISCAETLASARNIFLGTPPDLILLDVLLPDGSGYDFCSEIRKMSNVPIIFLTCMKEDGNVITGLEHGGDDYIIKPYNLEILHARILTQLRKIGRVTGDISLPPLYINLTSGDVKMNDTHISLSAKELRLLTYLVENRGQELSEEQIYDAVWNAPLDTMGNTVRMNISRIRQKLSLNEESSFELSYTSNHKYMFLRTQYICD